MKLEKLRLKNFRGFKDLELNLHPDVTVVAGINGSGKTSILDAIASMLVDVIGRSAEHQFGKMDVHSGQQSGEIELSGSFNGKRCGAQFRYESGSWSYKNQRPAVAVIDTNQMQTGPVPIWPYYKVNRHADDTTPATINPGEWLAARAWEPLSGNTNFEILFHWFREREDLENEERRDNPSYVDNQLQAVRQALEKVLPDYTNPRVRRPRFGGSLSTDLAIHKPVLTITKNDTELAFDQLSEGERTTAALVCDIARRLSIANPVRPLQGYGMVLIDEIELHLHPAWQARIIPALRESFPNLQLITTTHSPIVLSYVSSENVRLLKNFQLVEQIPHARGRDPNAVLTDVFEVPIRPDDIAQELRDVADLIDQDNLGEARKSLQNLKDKLGTNDRDIVHLNAMIELLDD